MKNLLKNLLFLTLILFITSFLVRFIYLNQISDSPLFNYPIMDEKYHVTLADQINSDDGLPDEPFFRAPLYPYLLAKLLKVTSHSYYKVRLIQSVLGSFLPIILLLIGIKLFDRKTALTAAFICALYPTFIYYDATMLITPIMVLLSMFLIYNIAARDSGKITSYIIFGVLLGVAGLARPNILLYGPLLFIWLWLIVKPKIGLKKSLINYITMGVLAFIVIIPVTIRNYQVSGDPVFIAWQGGLNFFIGNNKESTGWSATLPGIDATWEGGYNESIAMAEYEMGRKLKRSEVSDYWYDRAFDEIKDDFSHFISLTFKKIRLLINGYEIPNNQNIYMSREYAPIIKPLLWNSPFYFPFGLIAPLGLIGLFISLRNWRKFLFIYLFIIAYGGSFVLFFISARFRQPLIPILILFAAYAIFTLWNWFKEKNYRALAITLFCLLVLLIESNHNILDLNQKTVKAEDYHTIGNAYLEQNRLGKAKAEFQKSVKADPTYSLSYNNLGLIASRQGDHRKAVKYFQDAIRFDPYLVEGHLNLATFYIINDRRDEAIRILDQAADLFPLNDFVRFKLGLTYYEMGQFNKAAVELEKALRLNPNNRDAAEALNAIKQQIQLKR